MRDKLGSEFNKYKVTGITGSKAALIDLQDKRISFNAYLQRSLPQAIKQSPDFRSEAYSLNDFENWKVAVWLSNKRGKYNGYGFVNFLEP